MATDPTTTAALPTLSGVPLTDDQKRELSRVSRQVRSFTERRNRMIRERVAEGAGIREVARSCELDHTTVLNIIKPKSAGGTRNVDER